MNIDNELIQNGVLLAIRMTIAATVYIHMLRHFQDIKSYAKFNNISARFAYAALIVRSILATVIAAGVFVEFAAIGLIGIFLISILLHTLRWKSPFSADSGGWEYSVLLLLLSLTVFAFGAGDFVALSL